MYNIYLELTVFNGDNDEFEISEHTLIPLSIVEDGFDNLMKEVSLYMGDISIKRFVEIYNSLEEYGEWHNCKSQACDTISGTRGVHLYYNNNLRIEKE